MSDQAPDETLKQSRDRDYWAQAVTKLKVGEVPPGALNINVEGRQVAGALQGFGQLWQKTYRVRLSGLQRTPEEVMQVWKENFPKFQPPENHFYPPMAGLKPGEVIFIDSTLPGVPGLPGFIPIASGVMVLYSDAESFMIMTPEGFPEAGWNTFSVYDDNGVTVAQVQSMARAADPIYEFGLRFMGGSTKQEQTWEYVLTALAAHFGLKGQVEISKTCLDPGLQWAYARNVWKNAGIRTTFYKLSAPLRLFRKPPPPR